MLYLVTLEPIENRYTAQWKTWIYNYFKDKIETIEIDWKDNKIKRADSKSFLNWADTNIWKAQQIEQISNLFKYWVIKKWDKFLFYDAWHYWIIATRYMSELLNIPVDIYGIWHAWSYDDYDILGMNWLDEYFMNFEESLFLCLDKSFVATNYHYLLIINQFSDSNYFDESLYVTGLPFNFMWLNKYKNIEKENIIVFPNNYNPKVNYLENERNGQEYLKVKKSLQNNWYGQKIEVRELGKEKYEIIDWFHRRCALNDLWYKGKIKVVNHWKMSREKAIAKTISIEKIKIPVDDILEAELFQSLKKENKLDEIKDNVPYEIKEIHTKIELLEYDFDFTVDEQEKDKWKEIKNAVIIECSDSDTKKLILNHILKISNKMNITEQDIILKYSLENTIKNLENNT